MKQNVAMEQKICAVTGKSYETGRILLNKEILKNPSNEKHCITGWGISPEQQEMIDKGFIILVGCNESKSVLKNGKVQPEDAYRTGEIIHIKKEAAKKIFTVGMGNVNFVAEGIVQYLKEIEKTLK